MIQFENGELNIKIMIPLLLLLLCEEMNYIQLPTASFEQMEKREEEKTNWISHVHTADTWIHSNKIMHLRIYSDEWM